MSREKPHATYLARSSFETQLDGAAWTARGSPVSYRASIHNPNRPRENFASLCQSRCTRYNDRVQRSPLTVISRFRNTDAARWLAGRSYTRSCAALSAIFYYVHSVYHRRKGVTRRKYDQRFIGLAFNIWQSDSQWKVWILTNAIFVPKKQVLLLDIRLSGYRVNLLLVFSRFKVIRHL